jgi:cytochrome c5
MMNTWKYIAFGVLILVVIPELFQTTNSYAEQANSGQRQTKNKIVHTVQQRDGNIVFAQNCSRCHNAPQNFSPHIAGTITRHMRVRAGLSKEDELSILRFLNP